MLAFMSLAGATAAGSMAYFSRNEREHRRRMDTLDINVHVNGIRGKSTITRMIGGVFREAGKSSIAKTTGTYACVIDRDGGEHPIVRTGPANISEQYKFLKETLDGTVEALVVECMAVKPKYQAICQDNILRSPITVITNVRLDHQEEMGETVEEIAASLCATVPQSGIVITGEREPSVLKVIQEHCDARGSRLIVAEETELSRSLVERFDYHQFEENIAVVLAVAEVLGIDEDTAIRGMIMAKPDPGTTVITPVRTPAGQNVNWVPMFAVNDWESTTKVFRSVRETSLPKDSKVVVALNNRSDRTDRASMFIDLVANDLRGEFDRVVLYGDIQQVVQQKLVQEGFPEDMIVTTTDLEEADGAALLDRAVDGFEDDVAVFGMVNIHTAHVGAMQGHVDALISESYRREKVSVS